MRAARPQPLLEMVLDLDGERKLQHLLVNFHLHELSPVAPRTLDTDLGSLLHGSSFLLLSAHEMQT